MEIDVERARTCAIEATGSTSEWLRSGFGRADIQATKSDRACDVVTTFDTEAESRLIDRLSKFDSTIGFYGEETGAFGSDETFWLIDPIDGTSHFVRGLPFCTTMIALVHCGEIVASVVDDFVTMNTYSAAKGHGAFCGNRRIHVRSRPLKDSYVSLEINLSRPQNLEVMQRMQAATTPMATISGGWDFAMIADGRLDGRVMQDPWGGPWDFAPGALLVQEAGGVVANIGVASYDYRNLNALAVTPRVFEGLTSGVHPIFPIG